MAQQTEHNPFSIDHESDLPIGVQLTWRLRALIVAGRLAAGEALPSVRRLADWANVNVNTVRAVYAGLEDAGLVVSHHGRGTFVAEGIEAAPELEEIALEALRRASEAGLSLRELAIVATACVGIPEEEPTTAASPVPASLGDMATYESEAIEVRHELRRQIARLEAELAAYVRDLPADLPTARAGAQAHLLTVEELEQTRDTLIAKLSEAQKAAEIRAREEGQSRTRREAMIESDRSDSNDAGPLGKTMSWWRSRS
jgi:GntR family transcriptional regulator